MRGFIFVTVACLGLAGPLSAQSSSSTARQPQSEATLLALGRPIEREISSGEKHLYKVHAEKGQFVRVVVLQKGVNVAVALYDSIGKLIVMADSLNGLYGPEPASIIGGSGAGELAGVKIRVLPLDTATIQKWVRTWSTAYLSYLEARGAERTPARRHWADRTEELLQSLGADLVQPALSGLDDERLTLELIIAPGQLAGLPIHAAPLVGKRCAAENVGSTVYVPNIAVLSTQEDNYVAPAKVLCVLSDPKADLPLAATETTSVADAFQRSGAAVTLLTVVGQAVGTAALDQLLPPKN